MFITSLDKAWHMSPTLFPFCGLCALSPHLRLLPWADVTLEMLSQMHSPSWSPLDSAWDSVRCYPPPSLSGLDKISFVLRGALRCGPSQHLAPCLSHLSARVSSTGSQATKDLGGPALQWVISSCQTTETLWTIIDKALNGWIWVALASMDVSLGSQWWTPRSGWDMVTTAGSQHLFPSRAAFSLGKK